MAAPAVKKKKGANKVYTKYKVEGDKLVRTNEFSPKGGPGVFMANHKDRLTCGKTGYTKFKNRS